MESRREPSKSQENFMKRFTVGSAIAMAVLSLVSAAYAAEPASDADKTFVGKVSQGGLYEVKASQLAEKKATPKDVKKLAATEVRDHEKVNSKLKKIAKKVGIPVSPTLNDTFSARLDKLKNTPTAEFDAAYIADMKDIHDGDEKLFAEEATDGSSNFKAFAHQTDAIVKSHIAALNALKM
jgi:putative membrane protein